jgi:hypothetical protein
MKLILSLAFILVPVCVGCGGGGGSGADGGTDAAGDVSADVKSGDAAMDAVSSDAPADGPSADAGDAGSLVTQCQAQAQHFATLCAGDDTRPCMWNAYAQLCATGQTQLLIDSMNCLDQNTCRTFSDPNEGLSCLNTVHASEETTASTSWIESECMTCGGSMCSTQVGPAEIFPYLTDADIAALSSCEGSACDLPSLIQGCASSIPDVNLFLACAM